MYIWRTLSPSDTVPLEIWADTIKIVTDPESPVLVDLLNCHLTEWHGYVTRMH